MLADCRFGFLRYTINEARYDGDDALATTLGIPGLNTSAAGSGGAPGFTVDWLSSFGSGNNGINHCNWPLDEAEQELEVSISGRRRWASLPSRLPGAYSQNRVKSLLQSGNGAFWVGTVGGLLKRTRGRYEPSQELQHRTRPYTDPRWRRMDRHYRSGPLDLA